MDYIDGNNKEILKNMNEFFNFLLDYSFFVQSKKIPGC